MNQRVIDDILQAIRELGEASSFQIAKTVGKNRNTLFFLGYGTLYRCLYALEKQEKIKSRMDGKTKLYQINVKDKT